MGHHEETNSEIIELDDGSGVVVRRAEPADDDALIRLGGAAFEILDGPDRTPAPRSGDPQEAFVAVTPESGVIGAAWLEIDEHEPLHARLRLTLEPGLRHVGVEAALACRTAEYARERGCSQVTAYIPLISSDVLDSLGAAGLRVVSSLSFGGTAKVLLDVL